MTHTYNAYGGQVIYAGVDERGPFSMGNFSDQDIAVALGRMWNENRIYDMPFFLKHHRLTPAMVVTAIDSANPGAGDGRESVLRAVREHGDVLQAWYDANPLETAGG